MSSKENFNALLCEFMEDLSSTFDEYQCLELAVDSLKKIIKDNSSTPLPLCVFQSIMGGFRAGAVQNRDPVMVQTLQDAVTSVGLNIDIKSAYESTDDATKDAIWEYIGGLYTAAGTLTEAGTVDTINIASVDTILASASTMDPENAEAMMNSIMCLVPPALKEFVDDKVHEYQQQIENGELSTEDIMQQVKASMCQLS